MTSKYFITINVLGFKYYFMKQFEVTCLRCMSVAELEADPRSQGFCLYVSSQLLSSQTWASDDACLTVLRMSLPRAQAEVLSTFIFLMKKPPGMANITVSMNFHHSLPLFVAHYLLQSLKGICKTLRLCCSLHWTSVQAWFCSGVLNRLRWEQLNLWQSFLLQPSAFRCVFFSGLKCRKIWSVSGVSMQFCSWCVCGRRGI